MQVKEQLKRKTKYKTRKQISSEITTRGEYREKENCLHKNKKMRTMNSGGKKISMNY